MEETTDSLWCSSQVSLRDITERVTECLNDLVSRYCFKSSITFRTECSQKQWIVGTLRMNDSLLKHGENSNITCAFANC